MLATAVIGAGPAGLLFSLIGKLSMGEAWELQLFDKRESYVRTHRLRMDPELYLAIQKALDASWASLRPAVTEPTSTAHRCAATRT